MSLITVAIPSIDTMDGNRRARFDVSFSDATEWGGELRHRGLLVVTGHDDGTLGIDTHLWDGSGTHQAHLTSQAPAPANTMFEYFTTMIHTHHITHFSNDTELLTRVVHAWVCGHTPQ